METQRRKGDTAATSKQWTKKKMLSEISKLYNPL